MTSELHADSAGGLASQDSRREPGRSGEVGGDSRTAAAAAAEGGGRAVSLAAQSGPGRAGSRLQNCRAAEGRLTVVSAGHWAENWSAGAPFPDGVDGPRDSAVSADT